MRSGRVSLFAHRTEMQERQQNSRQSPKIFIYHIYNVFEDSLLALIHVYLFHFLNLRIKAHNFGSIPYQNESCRDAILDSKRCLHKDLSPVGTLFWITSNDQVVIRPSKKMQERQQNSA